MCDRGHKIRRISGTILQQSSTHCTVWRPRELSACEYREHCHIFISNLIWLRNSGTTRCVHTSKRKEQEQTFHLTTDALVSGFDLARHSAVQVLRPESRAAHEPRQSERALWRRPRGRSTGGFLVQLLPARQIFGKRTLSSPSALA